MTQRTEPDQKDPHAMARHWYARMETDNLDDSEACKATVEGFLNWLEADESNWDVYVAYETAMRELPNLN